MSVFQLFVGKCDSIYIPFFRQTDHRHCTLAKVIHLVGVKFPVSFHFFRLTSITTRPTTRSRLTSIVPLFSLYLLAALCCHFSFFCSEKVHQSTFVRHTEQQYQQNFQPMNHQISGMSSPD